LNLIRSSVINQRKNRLTDSSSTACRSGTTGTRQRAAGRSRRGSKCVCTGRCGTPIEDWATRAAATRRTGSRPRSMRTTATSAGRRERPPPACRGAAPSRRNQRGSTRARRCGRRGTTSSTTTAGIRVWRTGSRRNAARITNHTLCASCVFVN
jgi:hypothetical protein